MIKKLTGQRCANTYGTLGECRNHSKQPDLVLSLTGGVKHNRTHNPIDVIAKPHLRPGSFSESGIVGPKQGY